MPQDVSQVRVGRSVVSYGGYDVGFTVGEITLTYSPEYRMFMADQLSAANKAFFVQEAVTVEVPMAQSTALGLSEARAFAQGKLDGAPPVSTPGATTLDANAAAGATALEVVSIADFADGETIIVGTGNNSERVVIAGAPAGTTITIEAPGLRFDHFGAEAVKEINTAKVKFSVGGNVSGPQTAALLIDPLDGSDDIQVYKAFVADELEMSFQKGEETIVTVSFSALLDTSRAAGDQLFSLGDQTV